MLKRSDQVFLLRVLESGEKPLRPGVMVMHSCSTEVLGMVIAVDDNEEWAEVLWEEGTSIELLTHLESLRESVEAIGKAVNDIQVTRRKREEASTRMMRQATMVFYSFWTVVSLMVLSVAWAFYRVLSN